MSGNVFQYIDADGFGDFGYSGNWVDITSQTDPGPPGPTDVALVETVGTITGTGTVSQLLLAGDDGLLTSTLDFTAGVVTLEGTLALTGASYGFVSDEVEEAGTSTVTMNERSYLYIDNTATSGDAGYTATPFDLGVNSSDHTTFNLTGFGTLVDVQTGYAVIGDTGISAMTISAGAELETDDTSGGVILGNKAASQGMLTITGETSDLQAHGEVEVGENGKGTLSILAGAEASIINPGGSYALVVGVQAGSSGSVLVSGSGSRLTVIDTGTTGYSVVGSDGTGALTIASGGFVELRSLFIGYGGGAGTVLVEGAGSELELRGGLSLGEPGTGSLQVTSGAQVIQDGQDGDDYDLLGYFSGGKGSISVSGAGSTFNTGTCPLDIGYDGSGSVTVSSGGRIISSAYPGLATVSVGAASASTGQGSATIDGTGANWTVTGEFAVGDLGKGTLLVEAGGALETGNYNGIAGFFVGNQAGSVGTATITGTASALTNSGAFVIGNAGSGTLTLSSGAVVKTTVPTGSTTDGAIIGDASGSTGQVSISGTGAEWMIGSDLVIGVAGTGSLTIGAGSTVSAASLLMALKGAGSLTISGTSAKLTISGNATFGETGKANVTIGSGGLLSVGGTAEIADGRIGLTGGELSSSKTLQVDTGQLLTGYGTVNASSLINASTVQASGGTLSFIGGITGTGKVEIETASTLSLSGSVSSGQQIVFEAATSKLVLGTPTSFASTIYDFIKGDTIDLSKVVATSLTYSGQTLTVHESGGASLALKFSGSYAQSSFGMTSDGHSGTIITHT